jgi:nitrate/TMAO reductase-like tetraheme cytochrome c subunit
VAILGVILIAIGTVGFIQYSAQPSFCDNCHLMEPYYESWATSSHRDVPCIECHYAPGIRAEAMGKLQAANQVVKYITGAYGTKPWAEIEDAACLRSGCHTERTVEGIVDYQGVRFDHTEHLGELRRGKQLRCTSCHSQIVQGEHVAVTAVTCYLCHFKDRPTADPVAGCTGCHQSPARIESPDGYVVDHDQYVRDQISCVSCHEGVLSGEGSADQARCFNCHNEPERIEQFADTTLMHRVHIADRNVDCHQCHTPIFHQVSALASTIELDCRGCHDRAHDAQRRLYAGTGGHGSADTPSSMFLARVACVGCHQMSADVRGHEGVQLAGEATCLACHGVRYVNLLPSWQREIERRLGRVEPVVARARATVGSAPLSRRATADSLIRLAEDNVDLVRIGKGAHNVAYADRLLRAALDLVGEAVTTARLPMAVPRIDLGPPVSDDACSSCHLGVGASRPRFLAGAAFDHTPHVVGGGMQCEDCHTPLDDHGGTTLRTAQQCEDCHHPRIDPKNCAQCHAGPGGAPEAPIRRAEGIFSHRAHAVGDLTCRDCHEPTSMDARETNCQSCHEQHHQPEVACLDCHEGGAREEHERSAHEACIDCHEPTPALNRWTPQICTSCHAQQASEHYAGRQCSECHNVPPMRRGGP